MEYSRHVEGDVSSSDEPDPKRHMSDNSGSTKRKRESNLKNVMVLLDCDVKSRDGKFYMPITIEMAQLKKPERGQFRTEIKFTKAMTEKDVEEELRRHFSILRDNGRLSCATAADNRTRLEFHYSPRTVWDGTKINRHIRGNSALYVLFERTPESVYERPESSLVDSSLQQLQTPMPKPMDSPLAYSRKLKRLKRKHDSGSSPAPGVVQNVGASVKKQVVEGTSFSKGSEEGGQQSRQEQGDHSANPASDLLCNSSTGQQTQNPQTGLKQSSGEDHSKESQEVNKVWRSVESNNFSDSAYESTTGNASGVDDNTEHSIGKITEPASSNIARLECYLQNSLMDPTEGSSLEEICLHGAATGDQRSLSDREWNEIYQETLGIPLFEPVITKLCPKEGPITGGTEFVICLDVKGIPKDLTPLRAMFEKVGVADLTQLTEGVYTGYSPASEILGKVAVTVGSSDGSWTSLDETEFEYHPNLTQELQTLIGKMPHTKRDIPLDNQTLNPSRLAGTVRSPSSFSSVVDRPLMADESEDILSLKALQCILFAAAATNDRECIEIFFSTSAGEAVFQTYRNSSILPEDIARDRGHQNLAEYLQNVHKRLSEEIVCNVQTVTIDWVELKSATAKKDICSGTVESQGLESESFLESDDDQSSYFADDETSICQSPSTSEFSNEDECIESKFILDGTNSSAERQNQEPTDSMTIEPPCEINTETLMGPYIQTTTNNTFWKRCRDETDQKEEQDDLEKPLGFNQEGAGPSNDHNFTSAVTIIAGETPNSSEKDSEAGNNNSASHHMQGPVAGITGELLCGDNVINAPIRLPHYGLDNLKQHFCRKHFTVAMVTGRGPIKDLPDKENAPDFDDTLLRVVADIYKKEGYEAFKKEDFINAIHFYTKGIKINCNDKELKAKLYNNRAIAHFKLGNHEDSLRDAEAAIELNPTSLESIVTGATACVELKRFEEAMTWRDKGLAIDKNYRILLSSRRQSFSEVGDKSMEEKDPISHDHGCASSDDVKKVIDLYNREEEAIDYLNLYLEKAKEDKHGEGNAYGNLGNAYHSLGDFEKAIEYHNLHLKIAKEVGDKHGEGNAYGNLGNAYHSLGDFEKAIEYHNLHLKIAKEVRDKHGEGNAYGSLGNAYENALRDFIKAKAYPNLVLNIFKVEGNKHTEGTTYGSHSNAHQSLDDFKKAIEYHNLHLKIAKEVGDKHGEGDAYGHIGNAYQSLGDFIKANRFYQLSLKIAKEVEDKSLEAMAYGLLGCVFGLPKDVEHYQASINLYNSLRVLLKSKDEWKVNFRNQYQMAYTGLWRVLVKQGNMDEALFVAEKGRAQALTDLMESSFCGGTSQHKRGDEDLAFLKNVPSDTVLLAVDKADVNLWVVSEGKPVQLRQSKLNSFVSENSGASQSFESFMFSIYTQLGVRSDVRCENRSLDVLRESRSKVDEKTKEVNPQPPIQQNVCLSTLYDIVMKPVADLVQGDELVIIPDGTLWLTPYAALKDGNSKYMCESFRIRLAPSLTSLRLIADCPDDYHKSSGALLVGNPWVAEVTDSKGEKLLEQLPYAKEEVEMIGKILNIEPITGRQATKREVLKRLSSVSLVHFAAHGCMETGEIALTPDPHRISSVPTENDYILTIGDVLNIQLRTKLVVLSCCHSGRGEIKAEGVVGIARAFMGAGARSVVVSLWAIDDEATLQFMKCFYQHLAEGKPASESLNLAMKSLRESDEFCDIKYWAPFLLIGDDVTFDFMAKERGNLSAKSQK